MTRWNELPLYVRCTLPTPGTARRELRQRARTSARGTRKRTIDLALLARAERAEIFGRLGNNVRKELRAGDVQGQARAARRAERSRAHLHHHAVAALVGRLAANRDVEEDPGTLDCCAQATAPV
jgi:hypothetical protein